MSLSPLQKVQLAKAVGSAKACQDLTGCPVELSVAQWAIESAWGSRQPGNNCFGVKTYPGCCGVQLIQTWEVENGTRVCKRLPFATFANLDDCFQKHGELIVKGLSYRPYFAEYAQSGNMEKLIRGIAKVYATDPDYANKLLSILSMPEVKEATKPKDIQAA